MERGILRPCQWVFPQIENVINKVIDGNASQWQVRSQEQRECDRVTSSNNGECQLTGDVRERGCK